MLIPRMVDDIAVCAGAGVAVGTYLDVLQIAVAIFAGVAAGVYSLIRVYESDTFQKKVLPWFRRLFL